MKGNMIFKRKQSIVAKQEPDNDNPLWTYYQNNPGRLIYKWHNYFDIYHNHFQRYRGKPVTVLEIGVWHGGSLQMWKHYFGRKAKIYGVDINPICKPFEEKQIKIFIGDQEDRGFLHLLQKEIGLIDIVIDDGGHYSQQQISTFKGLFPYVAKDGIYLVEDLHTSYWPEYGGGLRKDGTFIEYAKGMIDQINAWHLPSMTHDNITTSATGLHFYDSVLVVEKQPHPKSRTSMTGLESF